MTKTYTVNTELTNKEYTVLKDIIEKDANFEIDGKEYMVIEMFDDFDKELSRYKEMNLVDDETAESLRMLEESEDPLKSVESVEGLDKFLDKMLEKDEMGDEESKYIIESVQGLDKFIDKMIEEEKKEEEERKKREEREEREDKELGDILFKYLTR